jgi:homoserine dehydrogenase
MTHDRPTANGSPTDVILLGVGAIGRELLLQIASMQSPLRVCGLVDRSGYVFERAGFSRRRLHQIVGLKATGVGLASVDGGHAATAAESLATMAVRSLSNPVLVDATAAETTALLERSLSRGWNVVLANKIPLAGSQVSADRLNAIAERHGGKILHEATVGAGLPVIDVVRTLLRTGDRITRIEGCPSGTLGYLFGELGQGASFSQSIRSAIEGRYTEPDPRIDLSGLDVARKAIILGRMIGFRGELADVAVESLVPGELTDVPTVEFLRRLEELDDAWAARVHAAADRGKVLRYRARVTPRSLRVGLVAVPVTDPLASLSGTDNQFAFTTRRYSAQPLVIRGPGAGSAVTAAGVQGDLLQIAGHGHAPPPPHGWAGSRRPQVTVA